MSRRAFTLLELVVVLTILALLSGSAIWFVRLPVRTAQKEQLHDQIKLLDAIARSHASKDGTATLTIYPQEGTMVLSSASGSVISDATLPATLKLMAIRTASGKIQTSKTQIAYTRSSSDSFGILLGGKGVRPEWTVVCGLTGTAYRCSEVEGEQLLSVFAKLQTGRDSD